MRELTCAQYNLHDLAILTFTGEFDHANARDVRQHLTETIAHDGPRLVIDLTDAAFLDSTGLAVLVGGLHRAQTEGGWLRLVCTDDRVRKLLQTTGLDHVLPVRDTLKARTDSITRQTAAC